MPKAVGSVVEPPLLKPSPGELRAVQQWEQYLNRPGAREQLVARYLFEHLFDVPLADIESFTSRLAAVTDAAQLEAVVVTWGVRRTRPDFWEVFHDLSRYAQQTDPIEAGLYGLSRYQNL